MRRKTQQNGAEKEPPPEQGRVLDRGVWKEYKVVPLAARHHRAHPPCSPTAVRALQKDDGHACQVEGPVAPLLQPPVQSRGTHSTAKHNAPDRRPVSVYVTTSWSRLHCRPLLHKVYEFIQQVWPRPARVILVNVIINGLCAGDVCCCPLRNVTTLSSTMQTRCTTTRTLIKSSSWLHVSLEMARLWCVCTKSSHTSSKPQRPVSSSCHMATATSSCTHFCPFCVLGYRRWVHSAAGVGQTQAPLGKTCRHSCRSRQRLMGFQARRAAAEACP